MNFSIDLSGNNRNFGLDVLRAISISLVLLFHHGVKSHGVNLGFYGVEMFFILSGFLVGGIFLKQIEDGFSIKKVMNFWISRWFRILPLYYVALFVKYLFKPIGLKILFYVFFLQNNFYGISFFSETWSLVIEEWFYISIPIISYIGLALYRKYPRFNMYYTFGFILLGINFVRFAAIQIKNIPMSGIQGNIVIGTDALMVGLILALCFKRNHKVFKKLSTTYFLLLGLLLLLIPIGADLYIDGYQTNSNFLFFQSQFKLLISSFAFALILPYFYYQVKIDYLPNFKKIITLTSILTYSLYLSHSFVWHNTTWLLKAVGYNFFIKYILALVVSYVLYKIIEEPFLKLRKKILVRPM